MTGSSLLYAIVGVEVIKVCDDVIICDVIIDGVIIGDVVIDDVIIGDGVGVVVCTVKQAMNSIYTFRIYSSYLLQVVINNSCYYI